MTNDNKYSNYDKQNKIKEACNHSYDFVRFYDVTFRGEYKCSKCGDVKYVQFYSDDEI